MCFYPFSPLHNLSVEYASETIFLKERLKHSLKEYNVGIGEYYGSSDIYVDVLIKNNGKKARGLPGDQSISSFYIVYPNALYDVVSREDSDELVRCAGIADESAGFSDTDSPGNYMYHQPGNALILGRKLRNGRKITIVQPHPTTLEERKLIGFVRGSVTVGPAVDLFPEVSQWEILLRNSLTLLRVDLEVPIKKNEPRLMRLRFLPRGTSKTKYGFWKRLYHLLLSDRLLYSFELIGPYNVEYQSRSTLTSFLYQTEADMKEIETNLTVGATLTPSEQEYMEKQVECLQETRLIAQEIIDGLKDHFQGEAATKIQDWRINIQPGKFKELRNIREYGAAKICGSNRNSIRTVKGKALLASVLSEGQGKVFYQWKAGKINVCPLDTAVRWNCGGLTAAMDERCRDETNDAACFPAVANFTVGFECKRSWGPWLLFLYIVLVYHILEFLDKLFWRAVGYLH